MIGVLAYGSLITDPGDEIYPLIIDRIKCITPFNVEYARSSKTRQGAPTLIPYELGKPVNAEVLVLNTDDLKYVKTILWRRETRRGNKCEIYIESKSKSKNVVHIVELHNFLGLNRVVYTSISSNIDVSVDLLSNLAIESIDGIEYLMNANSNGIETKLSRDYELSILEKTNTKSLLEAINKLKCL